MIDGKAIILVNSITRGRPATWSQSWQKEFGNGQKKRTSLYATHNCKVMMIVKVSILYETTAPAFTSNN